MTERQEALKALLEKVETDSLESFGYDPDEDAGEKSKEIFGTYSAFYCVERAYHGSLDAALSLHEAVLPGWAVDDLSQNGRHAGEPWGCTLALWNGSNPSLNKTVSYGYGNQQGPDPTPARAWLIAILQALIAEEQ